MQAVYQMLTGDVAADLVRALLHTLWQGLILSGLLCLYLRLSSPERPGRRYFAATVCLLAVVVGGMVTFSVLRYEWPEVRSAAVDAEAAGAEAAIAAPAVQETEHEYPAVARAREFAVPAAQPQWVPWAMLLWLGGALFMSLRIFRSLVRVSRLRAESVEVSDPDLLGWFAEARSALKIRGRVGLRVCKGIGIPGVIGCLRPMVLLPVSMMTGVDEETLRVVLAHELAHIRRHDYLVNFLQLLIEAALFFNPCVWWISRQIREEREACCDAAGVGVTGKKLEYARALLGWLEKHRPEGLPPKAAVLFTQANSRQTLRRIRRIVQPQCPAELPVSLPRLGIMAAVSLLAFFGLSQTAYFAVALAGEILTPEERIAVMELIEEEYGQPEYDPDWGNLPEAEQATVKGVIRTADGGLLGEDVRYIIHQDYGPSGSTSSRQLFSSCLETKPSPGSWAEFTEKALNGSFAMGVTVEGYAPALFGPVRLEKRQVLEGVTITLEKGVAADVFVIDAEDGTAVEGAKVTGWHEFGIGGSSHTIGLETDAQGWARIEHVGTFPVGLRVEAEGYQDAQFDPMVLGPDTPAVLEVRRGLPIKGTVVSQATGEPVEGASIRVQVELREHPRLHGRDYPPPAAVTDADGRFSILSLPDKWGYVFSVTAPGYGYFFTETVRAGDEGLVFALPQPSVIAGTVIGDLEQLPQRDGQRVVPYACSYVLSNNSYNDSTKYAPVVVGEDGTARFVLDNLWGHKVAAGEDFWETEVEIDRGVEEGVVLDLRSAEERLGYALSTRMVRLVFEVPEGMPPVRGSVRFNVFDTERDRYHYDNRKSPEVVDGIAEVEMTVPGKFSLSLGNVPGYWFRKIYEEEVEEGEGPHELRVRAVPSGTIFGKVFEADGSDAGGVLVSFHTVKKSPLLGDEFFTGVEGKNSAGSGELSTAYSISPLPLEGEYVIVPHRGHTYVVSETIRLDEATPIREMDLRLPAGVTFRTRVLDPQGRPLEGMPCELAFKSDKAGSYGTSPRYTDADGWVAFERVNPDVDGFYTLVVDSEVRFRKVRIEKIDVRREQIIRLEVGAVASGTVVDEETGWPIPDAAVKAVYYDYQNGVYETLSAERPTDKDGAFRFSNLKDGRTYQVQVENCMSKDRHLYAGEVMGGQSESVELRVIPYDHSGLVPRRPD